MVKKDTDSEDEKKKEEASIDWFEDHEPYGDEEESEDEDDSEVASDGVYFDDENFNNRMMRFLTNQKVDVSLENMLDMPVQDLETDLPKAKDEDDRPENFDYMSRPSDNGIKYEVPEVESHFSKPDLSPTDRVLEEQKAMYKHLERTSGGMVARNESPWKPVNPEDTMRKDYLPKKNLTTGPYWSENQ